MIAHEGRDLGDKLRMLPSRRHGCGKHQPDIDVAEFRVLIPKTIRRDLEQLPFVFNLPSACAVLDRVVRSVHRDLDADRPARQEQHIIRRLTRIRLLIRAQAKRSQDRI